jgi:hypothetical protein
MAIELVGHALWPPSHCFICGGSEGQMIDTGIAIPGEGRMYICARICAQTIAEAIGGVKSKPKCSATKANGQPCSAEALPGHEVCVAHLKVQREKEETDALVEV